VSRKTYDERLTEKSLRERHDTVDPETSKNLKRIREKDKARLIEPLKPILVKAGQPFVSPRRELEPTVDLPWEK